MEELKFRAWDRSEEKMIPSSGLSCWRLYVSMEGKPILYYPPIRGCSEPERNHVGYHREADERFIFLQYTGEKDKNGVGICCSDIWRGPMCFGPGGMQEVIVLIHDNLLDFGKQFGYGKWEKGEVIGNIYENPELLNG